MRALNDVELTLLKSVATELIDEIGKGDNDECCHVRQTAFDYYSDKGEILQVQIMVVRDEDSFLSAFQTEVMNPYKPKAKP